MPRATASLKMQLNLWLPVQAVSKIKRAKNVLADRSDDPVTDKEVSLALGIPEDKVALYSAAAAQPRSLDDPVKSSSMRADKEGDQTLADIIEDGQPLTDDLLIQVGHQKTSSLYMSSVCGQSENLQWSTSIIACVDQN